MGPLGLVWDYRNGREPVAPRRHENDRCVQDRRGGSLRLRCTNANSLSTLADPILEADTSRVRQHTYSTCYNGVMSSNLAEVARHADHRIAQARAELVRAVRQAAAAGMTQTQIAAEIGRSQPEVSRLLHFHGTSPLARRLRKHAAEIQRLVAEAGGSNVRVFGSVATGEDREDSDIDLLFTMERPLSLMQLGVMERDVSRVLGCPVDVVPDSALRPEQRDRIMAEAVPL